MKLKLIAFVLALAVTSWAQSTTPSQTPEKTAPAESKATCPCCDKMASEHSGAHEGMQHCMHSNASKDGKDAMACCTGKEAKGEMACCGKDGKACSKDAKTTAGDNKSSAGCCGNGKCGEGHEMACCKHKEGDASAEGCCGGNQCGQHTHDHAAPGN